jgi:IS30 family transposase
MLMNQRRHRGFTAAENVELLDRWKRAVPPYSIGRAFGKPSPSVYHQLAPHEGIKIPAERINASVALTG